MHTTQSSVVLCHSVQSRKWATPELGAAVVVQGSIDPSQGWLLFTDSKPLRLRIFLTFLNFFNNFYFPVFMALSNKLFKVIIAMLKLGLIWNWYLGTWGYISLNKLLFSATMIVTLRIRRINSLSSLIWSVWFGYKICIIYLTIKKNEQTKHS